MKNIVSFNFPIRNFSFDKLIDFYFICSQSNQKVFLYRDGKACLLKRMTEFIAYTLTSEEERMLIVIEGDNAKETMKHLLQSLYAKQNNIQMI